MNNDKHFRSWIGETIPAVHVTLTGNIFHAFVGDYLMIRGDLSIQPTAIYFHPTYLDGGCHCHVTPYAQEDCPMWLPTAMTFAVDNSKNVTIQRLTSQLRAWINEPGRYDQLQHMERPQHQHIIYDNERYEGTTEHYEHLLKEIEWYDIFLDQEQPTPENYDTAIRNFILNEVESHEYSRDVGDIGAFLRGDDLSLSDYFNPHFHNGLLIKHLEWESTWTWNKDTSTITYIPYNHALEDYDPPEGMQFGKLFKLWEIDGHLYAYDKTSTGITRTLEVRQLTPQGNDDILSQSSSLFRNKEQCIHYLRTLWDDPAMCPPLNYIERAYPSIYHTPEERQPSLKETARDTCHAASALDNAEKTNPSHIYKEKQK